MIALDVFVAVDIVVGFIVEDFLVHVANVNVVEAQLLRELLWKIPECAIVDGYLTVLM